MPRYAWVESRLSSRGDQWNRRRLSMESGQPGKSGTSERFHTYSSGLDCAAGSSTLPEKNVTHQRRPGRSDVSTATATTTPSTSASSEITTARNRSAAVWTRARASEPSPTSSANSPDFARIA